MYFHLVRNDFCYFFSSCFRLHAHYSQNIHSRAPHTWHFWRNLCPVCVRVCLCVCWWQTSNQFQFFHWIINWLSTRHSHTHTHTYSRPFPIDCSSRIFWMGLNRLTLYVVCSSGQSVSFFVRLRWVFVRICCLVRSFNALPLLFAFTWFSIGPMRLKRTTDRIWPVHGVAWIRGNRTRYEQRYAGHVSLQIRFIFTHSLYSFSVFDIWSSPNCICTVANLTLRG